MILDVLGDLFAVPWFPTPTPTPSVTPAPPNSAELDSARAAWESAKIAWWGVGVGALGSVFAGIAALIAGNALRQQSAELKRERDDRTKQEFRIAEASANQVAIAPGAIAKRMHGRSPGSAEPISLSEICLTVQNNSDERIRDVRVAPGADIVFARPDVEKRQKDPGAYEVKGRQVLIGSIPPNSQRFVKLVVADGGVRARGHATNNFGVAILWSDPAHHHWWLDDEHGLHFVQDNELEAWPGD